VNGYHKEMAVAVSFGWAAFAMFIVTWNALMAGHQLSAVFFGLATGNAVSIMKRHIIWAAQLRQEILEMRDYE
jgi:hypothetical protein